MIGPYSKTKRTEVGIYPIVIRWFNIGKGGRDTKRGGGQTPLTTKQKTKSFQGGTDLSGPTTKKTIFFMCVLPNRLTIFTNIRYIFYLLVRHLIPMPDE